MKFTVFRECNEYQEVIDALGAGYKVQHCDCIYHVFNGTLYRTYINNEYIQQISFDVLKQIYDE